MISTTDETIYLWNRIERAIREAFIASPINSWEEAYYFDGLLELRLLRGGYPPVKLVPQRERKEAA